MKYTIKFCFAVLVLQSCQNAADYKSIRKEVLDAHDKVMLDGEIAVRYRMKLDTVAAAADSLEKTNVIADSQAERRQISTLQSKLDSAEEGMNDWMHNFKAELPGKSNEEQAAYYKNEQRIIKRMDSLFQVAIKASEGYLLKFKKR